MNSGDVNGGSGMHGTEVGTGGHGSGDAPDPSDGHGSGPGNGTDPGIRARRTYQRPPSAGRAGAPTVVVLRALGLGDLLTAVPALRALRRARPGHRLLLAAPQRLAGVAAATGTVDGLVPAEAPGRAVPDRITWSGPPPTLAVDLHGSGPESLDPLVRLSPDRIWGYATGSGPRWWEDEPERDRWCRLLTWYGVPADPLDLRIPVPDRPSPAPGAVVVHPGADAAARRWPAERFAAVAAALRAEGRRVVVTAGAGEGPLAAAVAADAGLPPSAVHGGGGGTGRGADTGGGAGDGAAGGAEQGREGDVPFAELAALVAAADAVVSGDTGVAHLATALGTPSVVLFGPVSPELWGPPPSAIHQVLFRPGPDGTEGTEDTEDTARADPRPGDPHGPRTDPRLLRITPDDVLTALAALRPPAPSPTM